MHIGFTGARKGMTPRQEITLGLLLGQLPDIVMHHGSCIGADESAHRIALAFGAFVEVHPPRIKIDSFDAEISKMVAVRRPLDYLDRNKRIVDAVEMLIAAPTDIKPMMRSGTWMTIRYAQKRNKPCIILDP